MSVTGMIYALVSRGRSTILASESQFTGNFPTLALDVLEKVKMDKIFSEFVYAPYCFFAYVHEGFIFLVMVDDKYEARIAVNFLKTIQQKFFMKYPEEKRNTANTFSLKQFSKTLKQTMEEYSDKTKVDKLSQLKYHLSQLQKISLQNMDKVIERSEKISVMMKKSEQMAEQSYEMKRTAGEVRDHMWWQNKKIIAGIVAAVLLIVVVIVLAVVLTR